MVDELIWVAHKLRSQPAGYLPTRLRYALARRLTDRRFPTPAMRKNVDMVALDHLTDAQFKESFEHRSPPMWHWAPAAVPELARRTPQAQRDATLQRAGELLDHRFSFRGTDLIRLVRGQWEPTGVGMSWRLDLNRHNWFSTLGFAYWYSLDDKYLSAFVDASSTWMDQYLDRVGRISWDDPFEVAARLNAWIWTYHLFLPAAGWAATHHRRFVRGIATLAEYLFHTIEYHSPGNHLLLEAKALCLCSETLPEFHGAAAWRTKSWRILMSETTNQICPDGVHAERSTMYHRIVAGELAELHNLLHVAGNDKASQLEPVVAKMASFQEWIRHDDDSFPLFGDGQLADTYFRFSAPALIEASHGRNICESSTDVTDYTAWVIGATRARQVAIAASPLSGSSAFDAGGYFVCRTFREQGGDVLVWDCGPTGYDRNRKHAHLDSLSFTLAINGRQLLIDPGSGLTPASKDRLRGAAVHTTVTIDGQEPGILAAREEIWLPPVPRLLLWQTSPDCTVMAGSHDGYRRLPKPVRHLRSIVVVPGMYWLIVDAVEGDGVHTARQAFHVVPGASVSADPRAHRVDIVDGAASLSLDWSDVVLRSGARAVPAVDMHATTAELYCGRPEASCIVTAGMTADAPFTLAAVASTPGEVGSFRVTRGVEDGWFTVSRADLVHRVLVRPGNRAVSVIDEHCATDAQFILIRAAAGGPPVDALLSADAQVWRDGRLVEHAGSAGATAGALRRLDLLAAP